MCIVYVIFLLECKFKIDHRVDYKFCSLAKLLQHAIAMLPGHGLIKFESG